VWLGRGENGGRGRGERERGADTGGRGDVHRGPLAFPSHLVGHCDGDEITARGGQGRLGGDPHAGALVDGPAEVVAARALRRHVHPDGRPEGLEREAEGGGADAEGDEEDEAAQGAPPHRRGAAGGAGLHDGPAPAASVDGEEGLGPAPGGRGRAPHHRGGAKVPEGGVEGVGVGLQNRAVSGRVAREWARHLFACFVRLVYCGHKIFEIFGEGRGAGGGGESRKERRGILAWWGKCGRHPKHTIQRRNVGPPLLLLTRDSRFVLEVEEGGAGGRTLERAR
jgi:hypothetical protein